MVEVQVEKSSVWQRKQCLHVRTRSCKRLQRNTCKIFASPFVQWLQQPRFLCRFLEYSSWLDLRRRTESILMIYPGFTVSGILKIAKILFFCWILLNFLLYFITTIAGLDRQMAAKWRRNIGIASFVLLRSSHELYSRNLQRNRGCCDHCTNGPGNI